MNKLLLLVFLFSLSFTSISAQVILKGVMLEKTSDHEKGDTVKLYGSRLNKGNGKYQYYTGPLTYVYKDKVKLLDTNINFWKQLWFDYRGGDVIKNGRKARKLKFLSDTAAIYMVDLIDNDLIYEDEYLYDYLYHLILKIHPEPLIKSKPENFKIVIEKSNKFKFQTFDNGLIILSTTLLTATKSEKDLMAILTKCVASIVLDYHYVSHGRLQGSQTVVSLSQAMTKAATMFMKSLEGYPFLSPKKYARKMAKIMSFSAWQEYNDMNFSNARAIVQKLDTFHLCTEKDYLLYSKITRATTSSREATIKALGFIDKAKKLGVSNLIDLEKEAGILYLRLEDRENAKIAFENYKKGLEEMEKLGFDMSEEMEAAKFELHKLMLD